MGRRAGVAFRSPVFMSTVSVGKIIRPCFLRASPNKPPLAGRDQRKRRREGGRDSETDHRWSLDDTHRLRAIRDQDHPVLDRQVDAFVTGFFNRRRQPTHTIGRQLDS